MKIVAHPLTPRRTMLAICLLLVIAVVGFMINNRQQKTAPVAKVFANIAQTVTGKFANLSTQTLTWPAQMGSQQSLHDGNYNFSVSSQSMPTMYFVMQENRAGSNLVQAPTPQSAHEIISSELHTAGFALDANNNKLPFALYGRGNTSCFELYASDQETLTLSCYGHDQISQVSQQYQPFVAAYNVAHTSQPITVTSTIGPVDIKSKQPTGVISASQTHGYDIAEAVVTQKGDKKLALFTRKVGDEWQFVSSANDEFGFSCKDYMANADSRVALHGQICLGDTGQVRLDSTARALQ